MPNILNSLCCSTGAAVCILPHATPDSPPLERDLVAEAEAVRSLLQDASLRLPQLVQFLNNKRKPDRAISQVVRSIQPLPLSERS